MFNPCPSPRTWWLVPIAAMGLGCASTGGMGRSAQDPEIRTIASIGDRPISVASGSPKSSAVGDLDGARTTRSRKGTVSGRVVDDLGEAIPNARVRVADGGLPGGRLVEGRTDRAGGFTLHGLRPGSTYTLIAEKQGQGGAVEGRIDVKSPETGVEIALGAPDEPPDRRRAGGTSTGRGVSERRSIDDDGEEPEAPAPKYKPRKDDTPDGTDVEDIDDLAKPVSPRSRVGKVTFSGWKRSAEAVQGGEAVASSPTLPSDGDTLRASTKPDHEDDPPPADPAPPRPRRVRTPPPPPPEEETPDDNPLPPAIEPGSTNGPGRVARPPRAASVSPKPSPGVSRNRTKSPGPDPGALTLAREAPQPDGPQPFSIDDQLEAEFRATPSRAEPAPVPTLLASPAPEPTSLESNGPFDAPKPPRRTTWDQLATAWDAAPTAAQPARGRGRDPIRPAAEVADGRPTPALDPRPDRYRSAGRETIEACDYDPRRMQIHDFRLPDLDGRAVGLKDFDADFLLLDFWGTWCRPCLGSVPHLVELQEKYGPTSLAVVGIACEEGPASAGSAHVADVARQLGINYTVLVTSKDGQSPIQESLKVYEYPTMILIDRTGRVVWRDRGASPPVLTRLDRALSTSIRAAEAAGSARR